MYQTAICTIFAKNYIAHARVLTKSFLEHHPGSTVYGLLCDDIDDYFNPADEQFITVTLDELGIPNVDEMIFRYDIVELSTAVKPFLLQHLFERTKLDKLVYFDPDILFLAPIDDVVTLLDTQNIVVVPHLVDTLKEDVVPSERHMLMTGVYNLGFIGLRRSDETAKFLTWWREKLVKYCYADPSNGLYVDQRWVDLAPGMFEGVYVHRDPGCDVAYWNMTQRPVTKRGERFFTLGSPVKFFHFSGYSPNDPDRISKRVPPSDTRLAMSQIGDCAELFSRYGELLQSQGFAATSAWPYSLGQFSNGVPIPRVVRDMWREATDRGLCWDKLLDAQDPKGFYSWVNQAIDERSPYISRLANRVYLARPDVQKAFPDAQGVNRREFVRWFTGTGIQEHAIPAAFAESMRQSLIDSAQPVERRLSGVRPALDRLLNVPLGRRVAQAGLARTARQWLFPPPPPVERAAPQVSNPHKPMRNGLNLLGYLSAETGVGEVPRALVRALSGQGYPVAITHLANQDGARRNDVSALDLPSGTPHDVNLFCVNADGIASVKELVGRDAWARKYNIAFWFWEIAKFPENWRDRFNDLNEVWVGSSFVQEAVAAISPIPVVKMGVPVVQRLPSELGRQALGLPQDRFLFLYAFDMLSIPERKNPLDYIAAYRTAFEPHFADVHMVLKVNNLHYFPDWEDKLHTEVQAVQGTLIDATLDRSHLTALFQCADAYVSLHRSEGFGLTIAESMRLGKPVIATDYSGSRDFLSENNGFPVRYNLVELERDYGPYRAGNVWAQPDVEHAANHMRFVFGSAEERCRRAQRAAQDIDILYGPHVTANRIIQRLNYLKR
jgi:glycosyltransferase involved in cell wall biosynthesis